MQRRFTLLKFLRTPALAGRDAHGIAMNRAICNFLRFPCVKAQSVWGYGVTDAMEVVVHPQAILRDAVKEKGRRRAICGKLEFLDNVKRF